MATADFVRAGSPITASAYNLNLAATRAATINSVLGGLYDRNPMGDTTITIPKQPRPIRDKREFTFAPFALRVVNVGSTDNPTYRKLFYYPDGSCDVAEGWASCLNQAHVGQEVWSKDGKWFYVADASGKAAGSASLDQRQIEYVFLHVLSFHNADGATRQAVVTNSERIPEAFKGMRDDCICIGRFTVPSVADIGRGIPPKVAEQYVTGQVQVYAARTPLKLSVVNIGTEASPEWVKCFYASEGAVLIGGDAYALCRNRPFHVDTAAGAEGVYFVAKADGSTASGGVPLQESVEYAYLHVKKIADGTADYVVTCDDDTIPTRFNGSEDYCCCIGRFTTPTHGQVQRGAVPAVAEQFVTSQVQVSEGDGGDHPFRLMFADGDLLVNLPDGCMQNANNGGVIGSFMGVDTSRNPLSHGTWHRVAAGGTLASPSHVYCHYDTENNSYYVDTNHADGDCNGFRIGTVARETEPGTSRTAWTVTAQHVRSTVIGYPRKDELAEYPFKLRVVDRGNGVFDYQVCTPSGSVCVTDFYGTAHNSGTSGDPWKYVAGTIPASGVFAVYAIGVVRYAARNAAPGGGGGGSGEGVSGGDNVMVPVATDFIVTTNDNVAQAVAAMGFSYDGDHPWHYYRVLVGTMDATAKCVYTQDLRGVISFMAPMDPAEATEEESKIGTLNTDGALLKVKNTTVTPEEGASYDVFTVEQLASRLVTVGATEWKDEDALQTLFNTFDFSETNGVKSATLSTTKLKYKDRQGETTHENTCFLTVDPQGNVVHGGNEQYNKLTSVWNAFAYTGGTVEVPAMSAWLPVNKLQTPEGMQQQHPPKIVGIALNETEVSYIDGVPSSIVQVGNVGQAGQQVPVYLSSVIDWNTGKISDGNIDYGSATNITTANVGTYAAGISHTHGNITSSGELSDIQVIGGGSESSANRIVVTNASKKITFDMLISRDALRGLSNAATVVTPTAEQSFDPYVKKVTLKAQNSNNNGIVLDGENSKVTITGAINNNVSTLEMLYGGYQNTGALLTVGSDGLTVDGKTAVTLKSDNGNITLNASANNAVLTKAPTVSGSGATSSMAIATCGWVATNTLMPTGAGVLKSVAKSGGGYELQYKSVGSGSSYDIASGNHTHSEYYNPTTESEGVVYNTKGAISLKGLGTSNGQVAKGDHTHGNITKDGKITDAAAGQLVYVSNNGEISNHSTALYSGKTDIEVLAALGAAISGIANNKATFSAASISDPNCSSGGDCLAYFDGDKKLSHLGNSGITKSKLNAVNASFDYTGEALNWTDASLKHDKIKYSGTSTLTSPKVLGFNNGTNQHGGVSLLDVATLPPKTGDEGASKDNAPVADVWVGSSESDAAKIARIGTSGYAARADHKHPLEFDIGNATDPTWTREVVYPSEYVLDKSNWSANNDNGLWEAHCTKVIQQNTFRFFIFRDYKYSKNGNLIYRGPEYVGARARYS